MHCVSRYVYLLLSYCTIRLLCYMLFGKYFNSTFGGWENVMSVLYVTCCTVGLTIKFTLTLILTSVNKGLSAPVVYVLMPMLWRSRSVCTLWKRTRCCVLRWRWRSTSQQIRPSTCCRIWGRGRSGTGTMSESATARFCKYLSVPRQFKRTVKIILELFQLSTKIILWQWL